MFHVAIFWFVLCPESPIKPEYDFIKKKKNKTEKEYT